MKLFNRRRFMNQTGAALVEFVIIVPLLLVFLFGIIEFSLIMYNKQVITNASREGARYGIVSTGGPRHSLEEVQDVIMNWSGQKLITFSNDVLAKTDIEVKYCPGESSPGVKNDCTDPGSPPWQDLLNDNVTRTRDFGDKIKVTVPFSYKFLLLPNMPIIEKGLAESLSMNAETVMNYE